MSEFKPYPEYKDSGVEWLGEVPAHWDVAPIASRFELRNGYPFKAELFSPEGAPGDRLIRIRDILKDESKIFTPESCPLWAKVKDGDVLIGMDGDFNVAYWDKGAAKLNQRVCALRGKSVAWDKFIFYGITQPLNIINVLTFSTTVKHLSSSQVLKIRFPLPPESETSNIVAFLDYETTRIDALVEEQQRLIELLKEKRQAVISHAVTKGLNPDVPMKDSGVEWLGKVPAHWEVFRLKQIVTVQGGATPAKERLDFWDGQIPWVSPKDMKKDRVSDSSDHITEKALSETGLSMINPGAVLIVVRGMILAHSVPVAITEVPVTINQDMKAVAPGDQLTSEYMLLLLSGIKDAIFNYIDSSAHGTKKLEWERFASIKIPLPELAEQKSICRKVNKQAEQLYKLIDAATSAMKLLQERRSALISAAVTGKIDVRNWQVDQQSDEPEVLMAAEQQATYG